MEDHRVQDGYFAWRDIMAYKAQRIGKRARRQNLVLSEYPRSPANMNVQSDMDDSQCSETESILSAASSASGSRTSRSTNTSFSLSTGCECDTDDDDIYFPSYNDEDSHDRNVDPVAPSVPFPESPEPLERAEDDTAIRVGPSRHIDYLSHDWREEDILPSWRQVVSNRKTYNNSARLENAAWRTWEKTRSNLKTVPADSLNWLKDCDVTWLYGPLQISSYQSFGEVNPSGAGQIRPPRPNSPVPIKPSLKKRSMSEIMLQKTRSASALLKQATAAVQAQRSVRSTSWKAIGPHMGESPRLLTSMSSPELTSPCVERNIRNVRFHEQVEQCIAVNLADEDDLEEARPVKYSYYSDNDYDSDDGILMVRSKYIRGPRAVVEPKLEFTPSTRKLIETLPSTLLKSLDENPSPSLQLLTRSKKLSSYTSQETLRPINTSRILSRPEDDEDGEEFDWFSPTTFSSKFSYDMVEFDDRAEAEPLANTEPCGQSHASSSNLIPEVETKVAKDEKTCTKCFLQTIPSWRNFDMCPECIRTLVLDDSEYDDSTLLDFPRATNTYEERSVAEESSQDIALIQPIWTQNASPTLDDFGPNESDQISFALPLRFAQGVELSTLDPGNALAELEDSNPMDDIPSESAEEAETEEESPSALSSEYYGSESGDAGSDNGTYHDLCNVSNDHSETDLVPILDPMKQALVDRIMEEFWGIFNHGDSRLIGCAGNTPQSSVPSSTISSPSSSSTRPSQRKRQRDDDDENSQNDGSSRRPRQPRNGQPSTSDPEETRRLACPFRKHDSRKYSVYNHRACALSHWETISRVKEHIYRCHQKSIHCKRCWGIFKTQQQLDSHITVASSAICEVKPGSPPDGITSEIERKLRSRKKTHPNQSEEDRWREIYRLLFPSSQVPSPYFASPQEPGRLSPDSHHLAAYESYMRHELPRLVRTNIESIVQHQMQPFEASLVGNLVGIIQDCQDRVFRSYREREISSDELGMDVVSTPRQRLDPVLDGERAVGDGDGDGEGEGETGEDFIAEIFQPAPTGAVVERGQRYTPDPRLFELCEDPMHLVPSDSGYGSEQICGCVYLCNCASSASADPSGVGNEVPGEVGDGEGDMAWQGQAREQDWCLYPGWNGEDLMDDDLHWEAGA